VKCPFCTHAESHVTDSRTSTEKDVIRRRRQCEACERRFTTYERVEEVLPLVVKKDGRREAFDRAKLLAGLVRATEKRAVSIQQLESVVSALERELIDLGEKEVPSKSLGERVLGPLRALDEIAYIRFASVYRSFKDIDELRGELDRLSRDREETK
jgi:transcriptional repressor NrdR